MEYKFSDRVLTLKPSAIREIFKYAADPTVVSLSAGNPSPEAFPVKEIAEISARISCGGSFVPIEPGLVLEGVDSGFPAEWSGKVVHQLPALPEAPSAHAAGFRSFLSGLLGGVG